MQKVHKSFIFMLLILCKKNVNKQTYYTSIDLDCEISEIILIISLFTYLLRLKHKQYIKKSLIL